MLSRRLRLTRTALLGATILALSVPSHAGPFSKLKKKLDKATQKVTEKTDKILAPVAEANQKAIDAQNQAMAPVVQGQQKLNEMQQAAMAPVVQGQQAINGAKQQAMAPVVRGQQMANGAMAPVTNAKGQMAMMKNGMSPAALKQQLLGAANVTDRMFTQDAALRRFKLDSVASPDFKTLRLMGTVSTPAERARAQALAAKQFPGAIVNQIRVAPAAAKANVKAKLR